MPQARSQREVVNQAAQAHGVDPNVLWGIYGAESSWGRGGSNWFGLVAVPRTGSFAGDANSSAATLARLLRSSGGSYEAALRHYSGNSYGLAHVRQLAGGGAGAAGAAFPAPQSNAALHAAPFSGQVQATSTGIAGQLADLSEHLLLNVALVAGGAALLIFGTARATGLRKKAAAA